MRVLKFGGTSLSDAQNLRAVLAIIQQSMQQSPTAVVLSAPAGMTNRLIAALERCQSGHSAVDELTSIRINTEKLLNNLFEKAPLRMQLQQDLEPRLETLARLLLGIELLGECSPKIEAQILAFGERFSVLCMHGLLQESDLPHQCLPAELYLQAKYQGGESILDIEASRICFTHHPLNGEQLYLMEGFIASDESGALTTLGRNGSDYSAAALAVCLNAECCEIWSDVDGIFNCDPAKVSSAILLHHLSYAEAMEISYFGARVLHPKTIIPIAQYQIPCRICNSFRPEQSGTWIDHHNGAKDEPVKAISDLTSVAMVTLSGPGMKGMVGMAGRIFNCVSRAGVSVVLITQSSSEYSISFCIAQSDVAITEQVLRQEFELEFANHRLDPIEILSDLAVISLIGDGMRTNRGIAARFFTALAQISVNIIAIAQGSSERSLSAVIHRDKACEAVKSCHQQFFESGKILELVLIGCGGVGSALLQQIHQQQEALADKQIKIRVIALCNSQKMHIDLEGIALDNWQDQLDSSETGFNLEGLRQLVRQHHLINPVIVDCTADTGIAHQYLGFMQSGYHVVTPSKIANTSDYEYYQLLRQAARTANRRFMYEATVGAGLPVIENLQNLLHAGDQIHQFRGVLSGSLSYLFGCLEDGQLFSDALRSAHQQGFTEPDPRLDLNGVDVARKVLSLAREVDMQLELTDVVCASILPASHDSSGSVEQFMNSLESLDEHFTHLCHKAKQRGKVLRYVGCIEKGLCSCELREIDANDPLYGIRDGENALAFETLYYHPIPLVLRGYGAGTSVTAAGIFSDLMRIIN